MSEHAPRVIVTGGRNYADENRVFDALDALDFLPEVVVHGACGWDADVGNFTFETLRGADQLAEAWAASRGRFVRRYVAHWSSEGRGAGPRRNNEMLTTEWSYGARLLVAFPGGRGTANCIKRAIELDYEVQIVLAPGRTQHVGP